MDLKTKVTEIATNKHMSLEEFHLWLLQQTRDIQCCTSTACVGKEFRMDTITFRMRGHCRRLELQAKELDGDYMFIHSICDY
jgi:hypothetical protein